MDFEIRGDGTAQGPVRLSRERAEYSRLVHQGYSNKEACRLVGIDARTGRKWRNGRSADRRQKAAPPISAVVSPSGPSRYLREADRIHIADRLREKATVRAIAAELGRSPSTVSREIRRNRHPGSGQYRPHAAQARADAFTDPDHLMRTLRHGLRQIQYRSELINGCLAATGVTMTTSRQQSR